MNVLAPEILKMVLFIICYFIIIYLFGILWGRVLRIKRLSFTMTLLVGFMSFYGMFQIVAVPMILTGQALSTLSTTWSIVVIIFCAAACFLFREEIGRQFTETKVSIKKIPVIGWLAIAAVAAEIILVVVWGYADSDDTFYVGTINTSIYTNTMFSVDPYTGLVLDSLPYRYALASYMMSDALFCMWFGIHPLILMRTILPVALILVSTLVYYELGKELFPSDRKKAMVFVAFVAFIAMFEFYSIYTVSRFQLSRTAQGKAILANEVIPMLFLMMLRIWKNGKKNNDWVLMGVIVLAGVTFTSTSFFLLPVAVFGFAIVYAIAKKNATALLKGLLALIPVFVTGGMYFIISGAKLW